MKFTEETLEQAVIELFETEQIPHNNGMFVHKEISNVLLHEDLKQFLLNKYADVFPPPTPSFPTQQCGVILWQEFFYSIYLMVVNVFKNVGKPFNRIYMVQLAGCKQTV